MEIKPEQASQVQKQTSLSVGHQTTVAFQLAVGPHPFAQYGPVNQNNVFKSPNRLIEQWVDQTTNRD